MDTSSTVHQSNAQNSIEKASDKLSNKSMQDKVPPSIEENNDSAPGMGHGN